MRALIFILSILSLACGQSIVIPSTLAPKPQPGKHTYNITIDTSSRFTAQSEYIVYLPQFSQFMVLSNLAEWYHVELTVGDVVCDYIHEQYSTTVHTGAGCTTLNNNVPLSLNQDIKLNIGRTATQPTLVQLSLALEGV